MLLKTSTLILGVQNKLNKLVQRLPVQYKIFSGNELLFSSDIS